jgi:hypothetical protein
MGRPVTRIYSEVARMTSSGVRYAIRLGAADGGVLLANCRLPLLDGARALIQRGITGRFELWSADLPYTRMHGDIEKCAGLTVEENNKTSARFRKWQPDLRPRDGVSCVRIHAPEREKCEGSGVVAQMTEASPAVSGAAAILHSAQGPYRGP